eukprot:366430-Chlamydomonas_euryale.AAC.4
MDLGALPEGGATDGPTCGRVKRRLAAVDGRLVAPVLLPPSLPSAHATPAISPRPCALPSTPLANATSPTRHVHATPPETTCSTPAHIACACTGGDEALHSEMVGQATRTPRLPIATTKLAATEGRT